MFMSNALYLNFVHTDDHVSLVAYYCVPSLDPSDFYAHASVGYASRYVFSCANKHEIYTISLHEKNLILKGQAVAYADKYTLINI